MNYKKNKRAKKIMQDNEDRDIVKKNQIEILDRKSSMNQMKYTVKSFSPMYAHVSKCKNDEIKNVLN
jgi:hypothetical protein